MVSWCASAVAGTHLLRRRREGGANGTLGTWSRSRVLNGVPFSLEYYSTFRPMGHLGQDFCDPLSQVSHCPKVH